MANTLTNIIPKILARGLSTLRERAIMPRLVNGSYSREARQKGTTVDVPVPTSVDTINVAPSNTPPSPTDATPGLVQVPLDQWKQNKPFYLTDKEMTEIDSNRHFIPMQMSEAIKSLANTVNQHIHAQYKNADQGVFGINGTAGTTPFATTVQGATQSRKRLHQQLAPRDDRRGVVDFDAEAQMLELAAFSDAEKTLSSEVKIKGEIGEKFGINWVADDHVATHTAGTLATAPLINNGAGYAVGIQIVNIDATSLTGTLLRGDIIDFGVAGESYCVVDNTASPEFSGTTYLASGNAITLLKFYPGLKTAVIDNQAMTLTATHVLNLIFHRDAFAFATRPLALPPGGNELGSRILTMQDAQTGLVLRLEVSRQHKQVVWEFDILYGALLVRPELCVRLLG